MIAVISKKLCSRLVSHEQGVLFTCGCINRVFVRARERYEEPKRAWGYFPGLLIKFPIIACGAKALPP